MSDTKRIGIAKGKYTAPDDFDANNEEAIISILPKESSEAF